MASRPATGANETARTLLIDRNRAGMEAIATALGACLRAEVHMQRAASGRSGADHLRADRYALVLFDLESLDDVAASTEEAVARLVRLADGALCIALSEGVSVSAAVAAMRAGAHDFVAKPVHADAFSARIAELARRHGKPLPLAAVAGEAGGLIGERAASEPEPATQPVILPLWRQEQQIIENAIRSFSGNVALAAAALELSPSTIYRKRQAWAEMESRRGAA